MVQTYVGTTRGDFSVDQNGSACYTIPIQVPPGTAGLMPHLSLAYNSASGNDMIGMGWRLNGLSRIARVAPTVAQDGFAGSVDYSASDRFALDGMRLMAASGTYGQPGAAYRTELDTWQNVIPVYGATSPDGGPDTWTVHGKDGVTLVYGFAVPATSATTPSPVREWCLTEVMDLNGNTLTITYQLDAVNNVAYPDSIAYTANGPLQPLRSVTFAYDEVRTDVLVRYIGGYPMAVARRLIGIRTALGDTAVRNYALAYQSGISTGRSQLVSITESDGAGNSLPPTTFRPQDGNAGIFTVGTGNAQPNRTFTGSFLPADMDGNGLIDMVNASSVDGFLGLDLFLSDGHGFGAAPISLTTSIPYGEGSILLPMDVNADGLIELVCATDNDGSLGLTVIQAQPDGAGGWQLVTGPINGAGPAGLRWYPSAWLLPLDVNGDGMSDLVYATDNNGVVGLEVLISNGAISAGDTFTVLAAQQAPTAMYFPGSHLLAGDFNGDGLDDLVYLYGDNGTYTVIPFLADPESYSLMEQAPVNTTIAATGYVMAVDINADGLDDIVHVSLEQGGLAIDVLFSNGTSFQGPVSCGPFTIPGSGSGIPVLMPADVNGDGLTDFIITSQNDQQIQIGILLGDGATFALQNTVTQPSSALQWSGTVVPIDFNGDGRTDLVLPFGGDTLTIGTVPAAGVYPDLLTTIANGLGGQFHINYAPLTDPAIYTRNPATAGGQVEVQGLLSNAISGATVPLGGTAGATRGAAPATRRVAFPKYVAAQSSRGDGRGSVYSSSYTYLGALMDLQGRGWRGFGGVNVTDDDFQTVTATTYAQQFPLTFSASGTTLTRSTDGALMKTTVNTYTAQPTTTNAQMVLLTGSETSYYTFAAAGAAPDCTESRLIAYDAFGNALSVAESGSFWGAPLYTLRTWSNDIETWRIGIRLQETVAADSAGSRILRQRQWAYDGNLNVVTTSEWNDQLQEMQQTHATYDAYGNRITEQDPSGAITQFTYDSVYATFPATRTSPPNAFGTVLTWTYAYDPAFGLMTSETDPNDATTSRSYDGLGRPAGDRGPSPSGTAVTLSTVNWSSDDDGNYRETDTLADWSGTTSWGRDYIDGLGRIWRKAILGSDGQTQVNVDTTFRSGNQVASISLPYYAGSTPRTILQVYDAFQRLVERNSPQGAGTIVTQNRYPRFNQQVRVEAAGQRDARSTTLNFAMFASHVRTISQTDNDNATTNYAYDPLGRTTSLTDPLGTVTSATYDSLGRSISTAVTGGCATIGNVTVHYDDAARMVTSIDGRNTRIVTTFDALRRPISRSVTLQGAAAAVTDFAFDAGSRALDRLSSVTMADGSSYAYDYDAAGHQTGLTLSTNGETYVFQRAYTPSGRIRQITFPDGSVQTNDYNAATQLVSIGLTPPGGAAQTLLTQGNFSASGVAQQLQYGNGVDAQFNYDPTGLLTSRSLSGPAGAIDAATYTYNDFASITAVTDSVDAASSETFGYDPIGRLDEAMGGYYTDKQLTFDSVGNVTGKDGISYTSHGYQVMDGTLDGETVFSAAYDGNGNMASAVRGGVTTDYEYDGDNQLIAAADVTLSYDYSGRRLTKHVAGGPSTLYVAPYYEVTSFPDGSRQHTIFVMNGSDVIASSTVVETGAPPAAPGVPAAGLFYLHQDHLHSTIFQTDANGQTTAALHYSPDGQFQSAAPDTIRHKFTGKEWDADLGLYYFASRYYDPRLGRFLTPDDRIGGRFGARDVLHRYAYAGNNPINAIDPSGHHWWDIVLSSIITVGLLLGAAGAYMTGNALLGSTLLGAGIGAASYSILKANSFTWGGYFTQLGIGAATGFVGGAMAGAGSSVLGAASGLGDLAGNAAGSVAGDIAGDSAGTALRTGIKVLTSAIGGAASGVTQQFLENAALHRNLATALGSTALYSGILGGFSAAGAGYMAGRSAVANDVFSESSDDIEMMAPNQRTSLLPAPTMVVASGAVTQAYINAPVLLFNGINSLLEGWAPTFP